MYPTEELKKLELRKLQARLSILQHRQRSIVAGRQIQETVEKVEIWRKRAVQWGGMLKFAPGLFGVYHGVKGLMGRGTPSSGGLGEEQPQKAGKVSTALSWLTAGLKAYNTFKR
jgi:hypothetical protein